MYMEDDLQKAVESLIKKGKHFLHFGELPASEEAIKSALKIDGSNVRAWDVLAQVYHDSENLTKARACYKEAVNVDPNAIEIWAKLGTLEYIMGEFKDALQSMKSYKKNGGGEFKHLLTLARAAMENDDCSTVLSVTSELIETDEDEYEVWELRGICQAKTNKFNAACTSLNMAIELHPESIKAMNHVGDLLYDIENYFRAADFYKLSLVVQPSQPSILYRYGYSLWSEDKWSEAITILERYVELMPEDPKGWNNLGVALREKGEVKRALECYNKALTIDPELDIAKSNIDTAKNMEMIP